MSAEVLGADVCIVGAGLTGVLVAQALARRTGASILVVEAGRLFGTADRLQRFQRYRDYGESPWPGDVLKDRVVEGAISQTMAVGGRALHWDATCPRFVREDFRERSIHGVGSDWPIDYDDLEPFYVEAEGALGVSGDSDSPAEPRSAPYPMKALPLDYNRRVIQKWTASVGIETWPAPQAKNSEPYDGRPPCSRCDLCRCCPTGAKYTPDVPLLRLVDEGRCDLRAETVIRRLEVSSGGERVVRAHATDRSSGSDVVIEAGAFVLATSTHWTPWLLLMSRSPQFPKGLANRSDCVGRYVVGHYNASTDVAIEPRLYGGIATNHLLMTDAFAKLPDGVSDARFDLRFSERQPRARRDGVAAGVLLGDDVLSDWRQRTKRGVVSARAFLEVLATRDSRVVLAPTGRTPEGDPLPRVDYAPHEFSERLLMGIPARLQSVFERFARRGELVEQRFNRRAGHTAGGCRMGDDPATSVCDDTGRCHDLANLYIVGAPLSVSAGVTNASLTFAALALRSASFIAGELAAKASGRT